MKIELSNTDINQIMKALLIAKGEDHNFYDIYLKFRKKFDEYELKLLADSIAANGIIQPLSVRRALDGKYEIIAGERRYKAAMMVGLRRIPCVLHRVDRQTVAIYSIVENLQRSNLTMFEEAEALEQLNEVYGMSQSETAAKLGIAQSTFSNKLRLLKLDMKLRERIEKTRLSERHARALLRIEPSRREQALDYIIANGLTTVPTTELMDFILKYVEKEPVERIVVGHPKQMNNADSENMKRIVPFVNQLKKKLPQIPVEMVDERFTSVLAHQAMLDGGLKKKARQDKALVDEISATIILQSYLESKKYQF